MATTFGDLNIDTFSRRVRKLLNGVGDILIDKNRAYGNSALEPKRIFSKASSVEQLLVRIDDKLSRIATSGEKKVDEDTLIDLIGYLVLLRIAREDEESKADKPKLASGGYIGGRVDSVSGVGGTVNLSDSDRRTIREGAGYFTGMTGEPKVGDVVNIYKPGPMLDRPQA